MPKRNAPSNNDDWDNLLDEVEITAIPYDYLQSLKIYFAGGKIWDVTIDKTKIDGKSIEETIEEFLDEYDEEIISIDFKLDTEKVKRDISRRTQIFLKKGK